MTPMAGASSQLCWINRSPTDVHEDRFFVRPGPCIPHINKEIVPIPHDAPDDLKTCCAQLYHGRRGYMLNDLLKQKIVDPHNPGAAPTHSWSRWSDLRRDHLHDFPNSLAADFVRQTDHKMSDAERWAVLRSLIQQRWRQDGDKMVHRRAHADYLLVHLRVGDVIEEESHSLSEMLHSRVIFNQSGFAHTNYVPRLQFFKNIDYTQLNTTRAIIIAGSHLPYDNFNRSCMYIHAVRKVLQAEGLACELRCGRDADDDLVVASHAKRVAIGGAGGFSVLIKRVALSFGARETAPRVSHRNHTHHLIRDRGTERSHVVPTIVVRPRERTATSLPTATRRD